MEYWLSMLKDLGSIPTTDVKEETVIKRNHLLQCEHVSFKSASGLRRNYDLNWLQTHDHDIYSSEFSSANSKLMFNFFL